MTPFNFSILGYIVQWTGAELRKHWKQQLGGNRTEIH